MNKVVIVSAKRTPIGSFMGALSSVEATELGAIAIKSAIDEINLDPKEIDEVFMGHVLQAGTGQAPARQASIKAGISMNVPCTTVNKVCASGMKAITLAVQSIILGDSEVVIAGGMENMSLSPHYFRSRNGNKFGQIIFQDVMQVDGLTDAYDKVAMGVFADKCAKKYNFYREDQDKFCIQSYSRNAKAWENGIFSKEIKPVTVSSRGGKEIVVEKDEEFKNINLKKTPLLRPAFSKDGTVTAANASSINDGAAALVVMSEKKAKKLRLKPMAYILSYADAADDPQWFTTAPAKALPKALNNSGLDFSDIDLFELNEAFSVVGLVNIKLLNLDSKKVNINGGAVSLGHPIGCSGARIVVTLLHSLNFFQKKIGAAAICNGGGGASAMIFKNNL